MSHTPNELIAEFPEHAFRITQLKTSEPHFARLYEDYHEVNRAIHRAETNIEPTDDLRLETMRKERLRLKDALYAMLTG
ncbi:YdcH family protein [Rhabdaerophilum sp. SD176]|uniref:YdcH family protein n=1 Tax=Rhabdaerophilum sp. SD176 TaxID=2983548 RepID=UPI0024DFC187|nr:YdcH family protein [Rhabdaerophilum sp. SD176]